MTENIKQTNITLTEMDLAPIGTLIIDSENDQWKKTSSDSWTLQGDIYGSTTWSAKNVFQTYEPLTWAMGMWPTPLSQSEWRHELEFAKHLLTSCDQKGCRDCVDTVIEILGKVLR